MTKGSKAKAQAKGSKPQDNWHYKVISRKSPGLLLSIPYDTNWSKNRMWLKGHGRMYINPKSRGLKDKLANLIKIQKLPWRDKEKLHISVHVYRPDFKADVQNFVDLICDAVSAGAGVDDRYFSGEWDWIKVEPQDAGIIVLVQQGE